ncbi:MAG: ATP-dependent 6-phosphofructokinase, partial [Oscillospiraceae bacterium]
GLVVIGGDGSFRGAGDLSSVGIPCVGIPGTIDNDVACTDYTIGFDTAMNTVVEMVDKLRDTAQSHDRCSVVEVMGRNAGYIALNTGIACGATSIMLPEIKTNIEDVIEKIKLSQKLEKHHFIIIVAEGIGNVDDISKQIESATGIETRGTVLGHVQRGGNPTVRDRVAASQMGYSAVKLLEKGIGNRVIGFKDDKIVNYDIQEALNMKKTFDNELFTIANEISF